MAILIDTHALAWLATGDPRLSQVAEKAVVDGRAQILVSAVTAYEFADLNRRGRFGADLPLELLLNRLNAEVVDYPAACWSLAAALPPVHRDPVDRMLVAHAVHLDAWLISADADIHRYPVRWLW